MIFGSWSTWIWKNHPKSNFYKHEFIGLIFVKVDLVWFWIPKSFIWIQASNTFCGSWYWVIYFKKSLEENEKNDLFKDTKLGKITLSSLTNYDDNDDNDMSPKTEDEFLYFCFKNIQIKGAKQASSKFIII